MVHLLAILMFKFSPQLEWLYLQVRFCILESRFHVEEVHAVEHSPLVIGVKQATATSGFRTLESLYIAILSSLPHICCCKLSPGRKVENLTVGHHYFISVRATNMVGLFTTASSDGMWIGERLLSESLGNSIGAAHVPLSATPSHCGQ